MFFAPPLAPPIRGRRLRSVLSCAGLSVAVVLVTVAALFLTTLNYFLVDRRGVSPQQLYHNTWQAVRDNIYDQSKLADWDAWEHKFDAKIKTEDDAIAYARQMVDSLEDPYTYLQDAQSVSDAYKNAEGSFDGVGIVLGLNSTSSDPSALRNDGPAAVIAEGSLPIIERPLHGSAAHKAGITAGDVLLSVDGKPAVGRSVDELRRLLRGEPGTNVQVVVRRGDVDVKLDLTRQPVSIPTVSTARLAAGDVGYIRIESFDQLDTADEVEQALRDLADCKAFIIDVRNNGGGLVHTSFLTAALFLEEGVIAVERARVPGNGYIDLKVSVSPRFLFVGLGPIPVASPRTGNLTGSKPLVVLINGHSASAAETFTAALKDNSRATVIGTRSFGKGIGQTLVPVGNGARVRVTNFHGFTPNGEWIGDGNNMRTGIDPHIEVHPRANLLLGASTDNQLDEAVEHLVKQLP